MRVVVISPGFPPTVGGVETVVAAVSNRLAGAGVQVEVWAQDRALKRTVVKQVDGLTLRLFPTTSSNRFGVSARLWWYAARNLSKTDLVHTHSYHVSSCLAALLAPKRIPIVFTPHFHGRGHTPLARALHPLYQVVASRLFRRAAAVVAVSEAEGVLLTSTFPDIIDRCTLIRNAVDVLDIHSADPFPTEPATLIVLGRLERYKRVDRVIEAFSQCRRPGQLVIIGDGPDRERLAALARTTARAGDIRILGYLDRPEVSRWLRTAGGVVSMSQFEAFGIVALEGVASGAAVLLSELPAHREVQSLAPAGVVTLCDPSSAYMSIELDQMLAQPNAGPRTIRDWSAVAEEHLELYRRLLK